MEGADVRESLETGMGASGYATAPSAGVKVSERPEAAVQDAVVCLANAVEVARNRAGMLGERIQPILREPGPEHDPGGPPRPMTGVPLADTLYGLVDQLDVLGRQIGDIHGRVEV